MRLAGLLLVLTAAGCATAQQLNRAERELRTGHFASALDHYRSLASSRDRKVQILALVGAARAAGRLQDDVAQRRFLERAVALPEVPGISEEAFFDYAELLRADGERARALNYYYRAAAGSEHHRQKGFPYQQAIQAIAELAVVQ